MQKVGNSLHEVSELPNIDQLSVDYTALLIDIDKEITFIRNYISDKYRHRFLELDSLVHHPIDYAHMVRKIGGNIELTLDGLEGLLPSALIMVASITASTSPDKPLAENVLQQVFKACARALDLDLSRMKLFDFTESRMGCVAPNLSAVVGISVAAKLVGTAGDLLAIASFPVA
ncbi:hypothetical protein Cgig2_017363 [Carnegiea gigantea]|uniref:Nop domain-containing protein n=1 Tax=Carnegiea gigantea TaxID=171969 RepID=A0A9Q1K5T6_9CARY|nr:hypothetical protein Cgig2_017363 [Carnegiea gigantea]